MLYRHEKRAANRLRLRCEATVRRLGPSIDRGGPFPASVVEVGEAGLKFSSREMVPTGERIELSVAPPVPADRPIRLLARVIWSRRNPDILLNWYTCGAAFEPAGQADARWLRELLMRTGSPETPETSSPGATDLAAAG